VRRFNPSSSSLARLTKSLHFFDIDLVIDIGANNGQFAKTLRSGGYTNQIVSFEPLSSAHTRLLDASKDDPAWHVHSRCAIGDRQEEIDMNISGNSVSSSILPMLSTHSSAAPTSTYIGLESALLMPLDTIIPSYLEHAKSPFLKIDTQGYEWQVLDGATETLPKVTGVQIELSLVQLYERQHLWLDFVSRLEAAGFALWSLEPAFIDPSSGRTLQWDGLFFRK